jgi:hypothetical protein
VQAVGGMGARARACQTSILPKDVVKRRLQSLRINPSLTSAAEVSLLQPTQLHRRNHRLRKLFCPRLATDIFGQLVAVTIDLLESVTDFQRGVGFSNMAQH